MRLITILILVILTTIASSKVLERKNGQLNSAQHAGQEKIKLKDLHIVRAGRNPRDARTDGFNKGRAAASGLAYKTSNELNARRRRWGWDFLEKVKDASKWAVDKGSNALDELTDTVEKAAVDAKDIAGKVVSHVKNVGNSAENAGSNAAHSAPLIDPEAHAGKSGKDGFGHAKKADTEIVSVAKRSAEFLTTLRDGYQFSNEVFGNAFVDARETFQQLMPLALEFNGVTFESAVERLLPLIVDKASKGRCKMKCIENAATIFSPPSIELAANACKQLCRGYDFKLHEYDIDQPIFS